MGRRKELDPRVPLFLMLPASVRTRLDLHLFSELEGRVPQGSYQQFFLERIREFFDSRRLDLSPFGLPGYYVFGPKGMIEGLEQLLKEKL